MEGLSFDNLIGLLATWVCLNTGKAVLVCVVLYLTRGKFNKDRNWKTADEFLHLNPNTGVFQKRYITKYTIFGVYWGFFHEGGYISEFSFWPEWAKDKSNRLTMPIIVNTENEEEFMRFLMSRQ